LAQQNDFGPAFLHFPGIKEFLDAFSFDPKRAFLTRASRSFWMHFPLTQKRALPGREEFFG
jgi:hypothetical protein